MISPLCFCVPLPKRFKSLHQQKCHYRENQVIQMASASPSPSPRLLSFLERAEEGNPVLGLARADSAFSRLKAGASTTSPDPPFVCKVDHNVRSNEAHYDVAIAGGTLGIFYATALAELGWKVIVLERGALVGRKQEWNISRSELNALVSNRVCTEEQVESVIATEFSQGRIGFARRDGSPRELHASRVLNVGVAPDQLLAHASANFKEKGGHVSEFSALRRVEVGPDAVRILTANSRVSVSGALGAGGSGIFIEDDSSEDNCISARVLIDAMGAFSPIAAQARGFRKPDGVCITVGSCMTGPWQSNEQGDLIYSFQPINKKRSAQYFWEAFPVQREANTRTTYMFAYGVCSEGRQSLTQALEDYVEALPQYQGIDIDKMRVKRVLFGFFPSYFRDCPTKVAFDRVLPVGDAGGLQSPISFGGFGCCLRHLGRITGALHEALTVRDDILLKKESLQTMQWYLPSLSVSGLFHTTMSVKPGQKTLGPLLDEYGINEVLWSNMKAMSDLGEDVQRPFLQDIITAGGLSQTLIVMAITNPALAVRLTAFLGPRELLDWSRHFIALLAYAATVPMLRWLQDLVLNSGTLNPTQIFLLNRIVDAATYGSGKDIEREAKQIHVEDPFLT